MTLGVALSVAAAALVAGLLVQRVALSEPDSATFSALRAATWLSRYRLVDSTFSVNGGPTVHGRCLQDWFVVAGRSRRGAVLRLDDGLVVLDIPPHTLTVSGGTAAERAVAPLVLLELGGCTRFLERRIETLAQQRRDLTLSNGTLGFALKGTHVALALDAKTTLPTGMKVSARHARGTSRIRFERVTPQFRRRFSRGLPMGNP